MLHRIAKIPSFIRTSRRFDNWIEIIISRVFFRQSNIQILKLGPMHMILDHRTTEAGSILSCLAWDIYKPFFEKMELGDNLSVLDIGANAGGFSLALEARGNHPKALTCVELNPRTVERLRYNIRTNIGLHANIENLGLHTKDCVLDISFGRGATSDSLLGSEEKHRNDEETFSVPCTTLDNIIYNAYGESSIDLCKIDVEGAESDVFLNSESATRIKQCRFLVIEIHHQKTYSQLLAKFSELGFELIMKEQKSLDKQDEPGVHLFLNKSSG
jgi:FkbM family methyltransferase